MEYAIGVFIAALAGFLVWRDARSHPWGTPWAPAIWTAVAISLPIVAVPLYLIARRRRTPRQPPHVAAVDPPTVVSPPSPPPRPRRPFLAVGLTVAGVVILGLLAMWTSGNLDRPLSAVGLNYNDCARNAFGATFCGEELEEQREQQRQDELEQRRLAEEASAPDEPEDPYTVTDAIQSPSGAIACVALLGVSAETVGVRCGLREGLGYEVFETGEAQATDAWEWPADLGHLRTQPYDELVGVETGTFSALDPYEDETEDALRCRIESSAGVRCRNATHGFRVSRQAQYSF
jgi:hypothetical protein